MSSSTSASTPQSREKRAGPLRLSLLDRLIDHSPGEPRDPPRPQAQVMREHLAGVRRDLEALLNTRVRADGYPDSLKELDRSLVNYGITDFTTLTSGNAHARQQMARAFEDAIRRQEPRFKSVRVTLLDNIETQDRTLRFRIDSVLYADPTPEQVVFDTAYEPSRGTVTVKESDNV